MIALVALWLATAFPSQSATSWMRPDAFHLIVGMPRAAALKQLETNGWKAKKGKSASELIVDYSDDRAMTLHFQKNRLHSIRFELFALVPEARKAFDEEKSFLAGSLGAPKKLGSKSVVLYDDRLPNVMLVLAADPNSSNGRRGLGMVVVRYFDPR